MSSNCEAELDSLAREIASKQLHVENQAILIEVLERDGHDMDEQRSKLAKDRSDLARQKAQQLRLLRDKVQGGERRKLERIDVDEVAYISGDGSSLRCRVVNISAQGAAIEFPSNRHVNSTFKLMLEKDRVIRSCRLSGGVATGSECRSRMILEQAKHVILCGKPASFRNHG